MATTCCLQGQVPQTILNRGEEAAREKFEEYLDIFEDDYYIEIQDHDIDFDDRGRKKVIDYVVEKYGQENVCQIVTFGTMGAKTVVRDVSRVLDIPLDRADEIAKMIPDGPGVDLEQAFDENPDFRALKDANNPEVSKMMQYADVLEGSVRRGPRRWCHCRGCPVCRSKGVYPRSSADIIVPMK